MSNLLSALANSASGMNAQSSRLRHISENMANADTSGYRRKLISFKEMANGGIEPSKVSLDKTAPEMIFDPSHPMADDAGYYEGSNVNLIIEIADAREAQRSYEANLRLFDQARQMTSNLLDLIRK